MKYIYLLCVGVLFMQACSDSEGGESGKSSPFLKVDTHDINFEEEGSEKEVTVRCNETSWNFSVEGASGGSASWLTVTKGGKGLKLSVGDNEEKGVRRARIRVTAASLEDTVNVAQLGWGKAFLLSPTVIDVGAAGDDFELEVTTNVEQYKAEKEENCDWVVSRVMTRSAAHEMVTTSQYFTVVPNEGDGDRQTGITVRDADASSEIEPVSCIVRQKGLGVYSAIGQDSIKDDIKIKVLSGEASSSQSDQGIEKSFDGDRSTLYHSNWSNQGDNYFPITLEYRFAEGTAMDYFVYYPRSDGGSNGLFKKVKIYVRSSANTRAEPEWEEVMEHDFGGRSSAAKVPFPNGQIIVSAVKFVVESGAGDGQGFASCAEMEFYQKNPESFDYQTLFKDPSCSELKEGVGENDIKECSYSFFKNIAWYMLKKKYESEFRIASYKAYPNPDVQAKLNKTTAYSLLDNPTGMAVEAKEVLVVMADLKGQTVSLRVQNLDKPGGDGFGGDEYPLSDGVNKLTMLNKGLVYVMYHTDNLEGLESLPEVKVHFATGTVNGYYDSQNAERSGDWEKLLEHATNKYFDVVGRYAHLTFPTQDFRSHTKNLKDLIDIYDSIVHNEQRLLGLEKYNEMFKNRMYLNVMYHSYMYSTSYHTGYEESTLSELCDEEKLKTSSVWGPAHEIGHSNQTRPGLMWTGMTEVTNNIMSEYIQTSIFGNESRLQSEDMSSDGAVNRYSKAWNGIVVRGIPHNAHDDVFCKLVPFWQLELYFGKVLGRTPEEESDGGGFYPDVYEYIRKHEDKQGAGAQQLEFVYIASKESKMNLLRFFEKWGFLRKIDTTIEDYGTAKMQVTEQMIEEIRKRVDAEQGLDSCDIPLEYITDLNYEFFKDKKSVTQGSATRNDGQLTMTGWDNVIAFEVRENSEEGRLVCVSDGRRHKSDTPTFTVTGGWKDSYKVYAVQHDNKRIEVTFSE